jgi:hypothetical protein
MFIMQKITPFLWFNNNAEEALQLYTSVFPDASVEKVVRYGEAGPGPAGTMMTGRFQVVWTGFIALMVALTPVLPKPCHLLSTAKRRKKWIITGANSPRAANPHVAAG